RMKVLPDFGLKFRTLPAGDPRDGVLTAWRTRELHYLADNPTERICADPGDPRITAWQARQPAGAAFAQKSSCGTLGLVTSQNTYYSILHIYDLTNPLVPVLLGQRLLTDG